MSAVSPSSSLGEQACSAILAAFNSYQQSFQEITRRAQTRFLLRQWHAAQQDAVERLELYKLVVDALLSDIRAILGEKILEENTWAALKSSYSQAIARRDDHELAETFFNSVTRRIFSTVGVDKQIEFVDSDFDQQYQLPSPPVFHSYSLKSSPERDKLTAALVDILSATPFDNQYVDALADARTAAAVIAQNLTSKWEAGSSGVIEILDAIFYRSQGAYLIGRISATTDWGEEKHCPLVLCLRNSADGIFLDAVLLDEGDVSILFSFARSYFHVEAAVPREMIAFLKTILPNKRIAELYISIGYNKHGKTELYRDLIHHLEHSEEEFDLARGERGMVMVVFTMPSFDMVFKVIRDHLEDPKSTTRQKVMAHYDLVFKHDRVGRLEDAQEFEHLSFARRRFTPRLVEALLELAPSQVSVNGDTIAIHHLYLERRTVPLNLFIQEAPPSEVEQVVVDYGQALKDLAATNIFPGDILLKNFGVTRHNRVVFYDYDELTLLTDCVFRRLPAATDDIEEFASDPWFFVGAGDIFPEQFLTFLGLSEPYRSTFIQQHGDLFGVEFWRSMQKRLAAGEVIDTYPYALSRRLPG